MIDAPPPPPPSARDARDQWRRFVAGEPPDAALRPHVLDSWRRSRAAGVDPEAARLALRRVPDTELERRRADNGELLEQARPHLEWLSAAHASVPHVAYLVDADGIVLFSTGTDPQVIRTLGWPGYDWSEAAVGTNGAGTALVVGEPVAVAGAEHFARPLHDFICAGAPVRGPAGEIVGAVALRMLGAAATPEAERLSERLLVVAHAAYALGLELRAADALRRTSGHLEAERHLAEALRESQARFRGAFDHAAIGMAITSPDGRWTRVNHALCRLLGYAEDELVGRSFQSLTHPDDLGLNLDLLRHALAGELDRCEMEKRLLHKEGHAVWVSMNAAVVRDASGAPLYFVAQLQDISEQTRAEARRRESEARYRQLVELAADGIAVHADGRFRYVNPAMARLLGYEAPAELVGEPVLDRVHPEERTAVRARVEGALLGVAGRHAEHRLLRRDGTVVDVEIAGVATRFEGARAVQAIVRDVTERKHAEAALRESEARYRTLVETAYEGVWAMDQVGTTTYVNARLCRMLGYDAAELIGRPIFEFMPPAAAFEARTLFARRQRGIADVHELAFRRRDGAELYALVATSPLADERGEFAGALAMVTDVTERRRAEQALRDSEARYRHIATNIPGVVYQYVARPDGTRAFTFASEGTRALFGVAPEAMLRDPAALFDLIHPEDRPEFDASGRAAMAAELPWRWQGRAVLATGEVRWVQVASRNKRQPDGSVVADGLLMDVTELRQATTRLEESEERFRLVRRATRDVIWDWDLATGTVVRSDALEAAFQYGADEHLDDRTWWIDRVHPDDQERIVAEMRTVIEGGAASWTGEYRFRRGDGEYATVLDRGYVLRDAGGRAVRMIGAMQDLTERNALEAQLRQAQKMEAVGQLAGGIAHDFNNLLAAISGFAELLLVDLAAGDPRRPDVEEILASARRGTGLTRQLLAFSRKQVLEPETFDLNEVVSDAAAMLRPLLGAALELVALPAPTPVPVRADRTQLEQVLMNLAVNARDAMPDGGTLTVAVGIEPAPGAPDGVPAVARLVVRDTGVGMAPDVVARIFEPFFTTKPVGQGTGLGLATVHGIVQQSGGSIGVASEPGAGTTFTVTLPLAAPALGLGGANLANLANRAGGAGVVGRPAPVPAAPIAGAPVATAPGPGGAGTVLVAEDEEAVRAIARRVLERAGYTVLGARHGADALRLLETHPGPIDVLLSDVVMPEMGGLELARRAVARQPTLAVVLMSGYTEGGVDEIAAGRRADRLVAKPFTAEALRAAVHAALCARRRATT